MPTPECYFCGSQQYTFYAEENGFTLVKCDICGLLFVENRPPDNEIKHAHKQGKHRGIKALNATGVFNLAKVNQYLKVLEDLYKDHWGDNILWLDVGCGHGEFMVAIQTYFNEVVVKGTEPNVHKQESAREKGLDVSYFDIDLHNKKYDVISMLNVYSHLPDPPGFLASLKKLLKSKGEILLQTGDTADFTPHEHFRPFYLPDHLSFANEKIVVDIMENLGFEILSINKYPFLQFDPNRLMRELIKALLPHYESKFRYYWNWRKYSQMDMYIRGRLQN